MYHIWNICKKRRDMSYSFPRYLHTAAYQRMLYLTSVSWTFLHRGALEHVTWLWRRLHEIVLWARNTLGWRWVLRVAYLSHSTCNTAWCLSCTISFTTIIIIITAHPRGPRPIRSCDSGHVTQVSWDFTGT